MGSGWLYVISNRSLCDFRQAMIGEKRSMRCRKKVMNQGSSNITSAIALCKLFFRESCVAGSFEAISVGMIV
jgi:hypothetical protein